MNQPNDDLLTALRAARPDPGYQPSPASPEATALMTRILNIHPERDRASRPIHRRLVLAGIPAMAGAAAVGMAVAARTGASSPASLVPTAASVRIAVLDAFERLSGDTHVMVETIHGAKVPAVAVRSWVYPAFPRPGQQVMLRVAQARNGVPEQDIEAVYVQPGPGNGSARGQVLKVDYADRTWSRQQTLLSATAYQGALSPSAIRKQIADGEFTVAGTERIAGRPAIRLDWSAPGDGSGKATILWVDAKTGLALRAVLSAANGASITISYQILPATSANMKLLT